MKLVRISFEIKANKMLFKLNSGVWSLEFLSEIIHFILGISYRYHISCY